MATLSEDAVEVISGDLGPQVRSVLAQQGVTSARRLTIEVKNGSVTLHGLVASFYERQLCISCCQRIPGVVRFIDNLTVALPPLR